ncbi:hypothetical protein [Streptomonospora arabica]|uniref:DUF4287 domain-containing protein n=1 Tax=Streptomonospora arabica TaxID=412417 RepID=A0ABV9SSF6_9ACTN
MTGNKSFKSRVRARMEKTGESYTAARRHLVGAAEDSAAPDATAPAGPRPEGVSALLPPDASVRERTGRGIEEWFALLDEWGARQRTHTEIARHLTADQGVDGWWAQSVTVAYEQSRGMRAPGQRSDGSFSATASKTVAVSADRLFAAFADSGVRERWLPGAPLRVRTATPARSWRADWSGAGAGRLVAAFTAKGPDKAAVSLEHEKLPDAEAAAAMRTHWRERLQALKHLLEDS